MAAARTDQRRQRVAVNQQEAVRGEAGGAADQVDQNRRSKLLGRRLHGGSAARLASIWPMASTTASKVSMVEAWRAL